MLLPFGYFTEMGPDDDARLTLSRKTRFPSIKDRYSYRLGSAIPNPDLEAERATTLEGGWTHRFGRSARLDAALFYSDIKDLIQQVDLTPSVYPDGRRRADAFTLVGLRADYAFQRGLTARLGVENPGDVDYAYQEGYPEPGRT
ncbi:TonB-dependent receptor domain-containing protein [Endothiovibrio diazotrophicus]